MKTIPVIAKPDHLNSVTRSRNPLSAIAELIWNAIDAEADVIEVETVQNKLGGLEALMVKDNGFGLPYEYAFSSFGSLGGSWKREKRTTDSSHRRIHGKNGKGRFKAFSIGDCCEWRFIYQEKGKRYQYSVQGESNDLAAFAISDEKLPTTDKVGTVVTISDIQKDFPSLLRKHATLKLPEVFALILTQYPDIRIIYDGEPISPDKVKISTTTIDMEKESPDDGILFKPEITIVEWSMSQERSLILCTKDGFQLRELKPAIKTPGCKNWTAYIKTDLFKQLDADRRLDLEELDSSFSEMLSLAKNRISQHFQEREAIRTEVLIEEWKMEGIYPFDESGDSFHSETQREIFDLLAANVNRHLPEFESSSALNKKLVFRMLKDLLEENPVALKCIVEEVLCLPKADAHELEEMLEGIY